MDVVNLVKYTHRLTNKLQAQKHTRTKKTPKLLLKCLNSKNLLFNKCYGIFLLFYTFPIKHGSKGIIKLPINLCTSQ